MIKISEKELIIGLIEGDLKSYELLFDKYYGRIVGFAQQLVQNHWIAEEIAQNVFMKLWINRGVIKRDSILSAYLFLLARNEVIDHFRTQQRFIKYQSSAEFEDAEDMQINYDLELIQQIVEQTVSQMPEQRKRIYKLSREENMSNVDIATSLGISKRTVEKHISLALEQIRFVLSRIDVWLFFLFLE